MGLFNLFGSKNKRENQSDKGQDSFKEEMDRHMAALKEKEGTLLDELPGNTGEFGFSVNNPILLTDIRESRNYLERLMYIQPGASQYRWQRSGSTQNQLVGAPVDIYALVDSDGNTIKTIYIWPYNKVNSKKVPEGFGLMD